MNEDHVLVDTRECGHAQTLPPQPKASIHIIRRWVGFLYLKLLLIYATQCACISRFLFLRVVEGEILLVCYRCQCDRVLKSM